MIVGRRVKENGCRASLRTQRLIGEQGCVERTDDVTGLGENQIHRSIYGVTRFGGNDESVIGGHRRADTELEPRGRFRIASGDGSLSAVKRAVA
jgi:hypothetical protein